MKTRMLCALLGAALAGPLWAADFSAYVDDTGQISRPEDVRTRFVHLGSWAVNDADSAARGFHDVYTEPETVEHYRKTGQFPDGATLVKEIRQLEQSDMTTGKGVMYGSAPAVWFVMVKDATGRFADNPLWGDGWGWALFKADDPAKNVATSYEADCMSCHVPAADTDRVFIQGYPTLGAK